jgi:hypothetical protein
MAQKPYEKRARQQAEGASSDYESVNEMPFSIVIGHLLRPERRYFWEADHLFFRR